MRTVDIILVIINVLLGVLYIWYGTLKQDNVRHCGAFWFLAVLNFANSIRLLS